MTLDSLFRDLEIVASRHPTAPAFLDGRGRVILTHGELARRIGDRSAMLGSSGMGPGALVAFGIRQDPDGVAWLLACLRAGVGVVALDPGVAPELLVAECRTAGASAVLMDPLVASLSGSRVGRRLARLAGLPLPDPRRLAGRVLVTGRSLARGAERLDRIAGVRPTGPVGFAGPEATALVAFTSGTTRSPRGVVHTPRSIAASVDAVRDLADLSPQSRVLATAAHLVVPALLAGGAVVAPSGPAGSLARATREGGITHLALPPSKAVAWAESGGAAPTLRRLFLGTAPLRCAALRRILPRLPAGAASFGIYGMTELLLISALPADERMAFDEREGDLVGPPLPGTTIRVAADGEVHVSGPLMARGYLGEPAATEIATGDIGRLVDGQLVLLGRRKEMLIRRGENIYPGLYEPSVVARAGLADAALVGVPDAFGDERAVLWIVPAEGDAAGRAVTRVQRLIGGSNSPFDAHARPDAVLALPRLPRAGRSAKVDRRALVILAAKRLGLDEPRDAALPEQA